MKDRKDKPPLNGCYVATLTPFTRSDTLDRGVIKAHTEWLIDQGVAGLCPSGTTGEFLFLSQEEKRSVIQACARSAAGRVPVIAGIWSLREEDTLRLAQAAQEAGAAGVFLPPPIYYPADDKVILAYYAAVHASVSLPVFAYNIPQYATNEITIDCLEKMLKEGIIAGVKDSSGNAERVGLLVEKFGESAVIFAASDGFASEGKKLGADGFISAIANIAPELFVKLWDGDETLQPKANQIRAALKKAGSISALKYLLTKKGFAFGQARLPYSSLSDEDMRELDSLEL